MGINAGNKDGGNPKGALVFGRDSALYGVAESGGPDGVGTIFKVNQDGSGFKVIRAFDPVRHSGDGAYPKGLTLGANGMLYGITLSGGSRNGNGVLFKMSQDGIDFHILHTFHALFHIYNSEQTGLNPSAGVVTERNGACYGTTSGGGNQGCGDVYKIDTDGNFSVLHSFLKVQGSKDSSMFPQGPLVVGLDNFLYGCTRRGGTDNGGIVYKINTDGSGFEVLHSFSAPGSENGDGTLPDGPLVFGRDGFLYGVTSRGGTGEVGVLFRVSPDGSKFFALHDFSLPNHDLCNADGGLSFMGLTLGRDGNLYGISAGGGANGTGTIFRVSFPAAK